MHSPSFARWGLCALLFAPMCVQAQSILPDPLRTLSSAALPAAPVADGPVQTGGMQLTGPLTQSQSTGVYLDPAFVAARADSRTLQPKTTKPTEFEQLVESAMGERPERFGRKLFTTETTTYAPADDAPVPAGARIAPGDELMVRIWGQLTFNGHLTVDRAGAVFVPQVGRTQVAGLAWDQVEEQLHRETARLYRNFELSVTPGRLHSIRIYLLGQAERPGSYSVSSLSTLVSALFVSGGPSATGSMRAIQLIRDGHVLTTIDLYDLLLKADKSKDLPLVSGDTIFIPQAGAEVAVMGSVKRPAIYELKGGETLGEVLALAGGATVTAARDGLTIERIGEDKQRQTLRPGLNAEGLAVAMRAGDLVHLSPMNLGYDKTVVLRGNVATPGRYSWHPGMRLSELMPEREALLTRNYWQRRNRLGVPSPLIDEDQTTASTVGEGKALTGSAARGRQPESRNPADRSAGAAEQLDANSVAKAEQEKLTEDEVAPARSVEVKVAAPEIDWAYAVIERLDAKTLRNRLLPFSPGKLVLEQDRSQDLELEAGDVVTLFSQKDIRVPQEQQTKYVRVEGEVARAGVYTLEPGETLRHLVERAGGTTPEAYLYGAEFTRESARRLEQQRLEEYMRNLALEIERNTAKTALSLPAQSGNATDLLASQNKEQLERMEGIRATGRVVLHLDPASTGTSALPEIPLEDGDRLMIPARPSVVNVIGAVYNQNAFLVAEGRRAGEYLKLSGGPSRVGDAKHVFLIRADGSVVSRHEHTRFDSLAVYPGDTLVVPEKMLHISGSRAVLDWGMLASQMAVGAAAINVLR